MTKEERAGLAFAMAGFATLSIGDAVVKSMAGEWPAHAIAALRFTIGALGLSLLLWRKEGARAFKPQNPWLQAARGLCLAIATICFFSALHLMSFADAMAIAFLAPVLTQVLAGAILGEKVRRTVWIVSLVALAGVAIILRPNIAAFGWAAFLPLISAMFFALMMVANRASAGQGSALSMQFFIAAACAPILVAIAFGFKFSGIGALDFGWPSWDIVARCAVVAVTASTAHWLAYVGTAKAGAAQVAPAIYVQMLVVIVLGWWFFDERPDVLTLTGAGLIIAGGLYLWHEGLRQSRAAQVLPANR